MIVKLREGFGHIDHVVTTNYWFYRSALSAEAWHPARLSSCHFVFDFLIIQAVTFFRQTSLLAAFLY